MVLSSCLSSYVNLIDQEMSIIRIYIFNSTYLFQNKNKGPEAKVTTFDSNYPFFIINGIYQKFQRHN